MVRDKKVLSKRVRGAKVWLRRDSKDERNCLVVTGKGYQRFKSIEGVVRKDCLARSSFDDETGVWTVAICER